MLGSMDTATPQLKPAILVISDTAFGDPSSDRAGDVLRDTLSSEGGNRWAKPEVKIVPDDAAMIEDAIKRWSSLGDDVFNLIITTGGTGFAVKDITPEASSDREP